MFHKRGQAYGQDLRDRVFFLFDGGYAVGEIAEILHVSVSYVSKVLSRRQTTGEESARPQTGHMPRKLSDLEDEISAKIKSKPDMTLSELVSWLFSTHSIKVSIRTVFKMLRKLGFTRKKKTLHATEQNREDVAESRAKWREEQPTLDPAKLIFIDETSTATNMGCMYGYAIQGERLHADVPNGHRKTSTFIGGLRQDGMTAPCVIDGPINGEIFLAYVKQILVPTLKPGDTVIMDNVSSHKVSGVQEAIEAVGAKLLYLPPYSPDFNPIEMAFSKFKSILRKKALRTIEALWDALGEVADWFSPEECANCIRHAGYIGQVLINAVSS